MITIRPLMKLSYQMRRLVILIVLGFLGNSMQLNQTITLIFDYMTLLFYEFALKQIEMRG